MFGGMGWPRGSSRRSWGSRGKSAPRRSWSATNLALSRAILRLRSHTTLRRTARAARRRHRLQNGHAANAIATQTTAETMVKVLQRFLRMKAKGNDQQRQMKRMREIPGMVSSYKVVVLCTTGETTWGTHPQPGQNSPGHSQTKTRKILEKDEFSPELPKALRDRKVFPLYIPAVHARSARNNRRTKKTMNNRLKRLLYLSGPRRYQPKVRLFSVVQGHHEGLAAAAAATVLSIIGLMIWRTSTQKPTEKNRV